MNLKRLFALVLALVAVVSLTACRGDDTTGNSQGGDTTASTSANAVYTVSVVDALGNPYTQNIIVIFKQSGEQVAMQPVNAEGKASKELPRGQYDVELQITQNAEKYHYAMDDLQLTAENTALEILLSGLVGEDLEVLSVNDMERCLYKLVFTEAGSFTLEDLYGDLDGTYYYSLNDDEDYAVTNAAGDTLDMLITNNLDGSFAFWCAGMNAPQHMVPADESAEGLTGAFDVLSNEYKAYVVSTGCTYLQVSANERNFYVFTPVQSGIYEFTVHNAEAAVGYYGSPFFVQSQNSGNPTGDQSITVVVKDGMIGDGSAGSTQLVIGIDAGESTDNCILSVVRLGDYERTPEDMPWTVYEPTYTPSKYKLPAGLTIQEFDLTQSYDLVYNEADGYYHLGTADGPVVLVRLHAVLAYGGSMGDILANANVGSYFYDEEGNFLKKELYNDCLLQYLGTLNKGMGVFNYSGGMLDDDYGVYPLTNDLAYIIQSYGNYAGWWDMGDNDYLFADVVGLNTEMAWLFMCCYAE